MSRPLHQLKSPIIIAVLLAGLGFTIWMLLRQEEAGDGSGKPGPVVAKSRADIAGQPSSPQATAPARPRISSADFDRLVEEWRAHTEGVGKHYIYTHEEHRFADQCVKRLGCGEDLIRLMQAVALQDSGTPDVFHDSVKRYLALEAGPADRRHSPIFQ